MKNFLIILTLMSPIYASAGTPDQDPVVANIRDSFSKGAVPAISDLAVGKDWICKEYRASKDVFDESERRSAFKFSQFDGLILNDGWGRVKSFLKENDRLFGTYSDGQNISGKMFLRVTGKGDLIGEWNVKDPQGYGQVNSVLDSSILVYSYLLCPKEN